MCKKMLAATLLLTMAFSLSQAREYKVMSFNVRMGDAAIQDGENRWDNRKEAVVRMLDKENPDIFGIQEGLIYQVKYLEQGCPQYGRIGIGRDDGIGKGEIMAIFYRKDEFKVLRSGTFWLSDTPDKVSRGWDAACNRTVTWAEFADKLDGSRFFYLNTHMDHRGVEARKNSVLLIVSRIKEIAGGNAPVILTGDFNTTIENDAFLPLLDFMMNARTSAPVTDDRNTFNGYGNEVPSRIDFIFGRNVKFSSYLTQTWNYGVPYISDHYPIFAVFSL